MEESAVKEVVICEDNIERKESEEFRESKERLKQDGHYKCWICDSLEQLDVHHFSYECALANDSDLEKLKEFCEEFDPYGYGKLLKNKSIAGLDDIRNIIVLCEKHHRKAKNGINETTFPIRIIQKLAKQGVQLVPEEHGCSMDDKYLNYPTFKQLKETMDMHTNDIKNIFENIKEIEVTAGIENEKLSNAEKILTQISKSLEYIETKIDDHIDKITESIKVELEKRDARITSLEMVPAKKWEKVSMQVIAALISTLFGFLAGKFMK